MVTDQKLQKRFFFIMHFKGKKSQNVENKVSDAAPPELRPFTFKQLDQLFYCVM